MKEILTEWRRFLAEQNKQGSKDKFTETAANSISAMSVFNGGMLGANTTKLEFESSLDLEKREEFIDRFQKSLYSGERSSFLSYYSREELSKMNLVLVKGHNAGFALKGGNDIVSVHNNSSLRNIGRELMNAATQYGGNKLDHFDGFLSGLYRTLGFTDVYEVYQWADQYAPENWFYDPVDVFDPNASIYAEPLKELIHGDSPLSPQQTLPNKDFVVEAEDNYEIAINPNTKYNDYSYGRPDIIFRKL